MSDIKIIVNGAAELELAISVLKAAWAGGATNVSLNRATPAPTKVADKALNDQASIRAKCQYTHTLEARIAGAVNIIDRNKKLNKFTFLPENSISTFDALRNTLLGEA